ncbi:MAG: RES domain-containing protein, partial [Proteobacteria bacterium]|nr:RES domain-containing protein [Pseudomonadota bacterium]
AAANFMGYDGILVPSARFSGDNLVILTENMGEGSFIEAGDEDGIT